MAEQVKVATPPKMVCQNCGLGIFNTLRLGVKYVHTITGKAECKRGRSRKRPNVLVGEPSESERRTRDGE